MGRPLAIEERGMLTDNDVLGAFSKKLSPGEVTATLQRLLRVPEAWSKLHEPAFLESALALGDMRSLTPSRLALLSLGLTEAPGVERMPGPLEDRLVEAWGAVCAGPLSKRDLETTALLALGLCRKAAKEGAAKLATLVLSSPNTWRTALACAWSWMPEPRVLISALVSAGGQEGLHLVAATLLADRSTEETARQLLAASPAMSERGAHSLLLTGEAELAKAILSPRKPESSQEIPAAASEASARDLVLRSTRSRIHGDLATSRQELEEAWNAANRGAAEAADGLAELAELEGDPVTALEARLQAQQLQPSSLRRAHLALAYVAAGRAQDALAKLPKSNRTMEELIAAGLASLKIGDLQEAALSLAEAAGSNPSAAAADHWYGHLVEGLRSIGRTDLALQASEARLARRPADPEMRLEYAGLLHEAADYPNGAAQASLALGLTPNSASARKILAQCLQSAGAPAAALPHWQILAAADFAFLPDLARCAIEAGNLPAAEQATASLRQSDPASSAAHILTAKTQATGGNLTAARTALELATQQSPQDPDLWIALAEILTQEGEIRAAEATLSHAVQLVPDCAQLHAAAAQWYKAHGRPNDALLAIQKASKLEPTQADWLIQEGDLLRALGHKDLALPTLKAAASRKPGSFRARMALAQAFEEQGDLASAAQCLPQILTGANREAQIVAARIAIRHASASSNTSGLESIQMPLEHAREADPADPCPYFWLGQLRHLLGQPAAALEEYQRCQERSTGQPPDLRLQAVLGLASAAIDAGQSALALTTLEDARTDHPSSAPLLVALSKAHLAANLPDRALQIAQQAVDLEPESEVALRHLAKVASHNHDWRLAARVLRSLLKIQPGQPDTWLELAEAAHRAQDSKAAREALVRALRPGRRQPELLQKAAAVLTTVGDVAAAQIALKRAVRLQPDNTLLLRDLARVSELRSDWITAAQAWKQCTQLMPSQTEPLVMAAKSLWQMARRVEAIGFWQRAVALQPLNPVLHLELARACRANGEAAQSLNHYSVALRQSPDDVDLALEAGQAALSQGSHQEALETLKQASSLAPDRADVATAFSECLLAAGRPHESKEILQHIARRNRLSPRASALLAIASLDAGDLAGAEVAFRGALAAPTSDDLPFVSRAALRLGRWADVLRLIETPLSAEDASVGAGVLLAVAATRIRCQEAGWVYAAAGASHHAPAGDLLSGEGLKRFEEVLERARKTSIQESEIRRLRLQAAAASGSASTEDVKTLRSSIAVGGLAPVHETIALAELRADRPQDAEETLRRSETTAQATSWSRILLGMAYTALGRYQRARQAFETAAQDPVLRPIAAFLSGRAWLAEHHPKEAIAALNAAVAAWPDEPDWHFQLATLYLEDGNPGAALPHLQQAAELAPDDPEITLALARSLRRDGQLSEAKSAYARAVSMFPSNGEVWKEAGILALATGDASQAEAWYERARTLAPSDAHCLVGAARAAIALGKQREATEYGRAAARLAPNDPEVLLGIGEVLSKQGRIDQALQAYDRALAFVADSMPVRLARNELLARMGKPEEAAQDLRALLEVKPESDLAWAALSEACDASGQSEEALEAATRAIRLSPRDITHRLRLARLSRKAGQLDRALSEVKQAQAIAPSEPALTIELGRIHEERRELDHALTAYETAIALDQDSPEAYFRAGLVLKNLKSYPQAGRMFKRAVDLNPKDSEAFHQLAAVRALELVHCGITRTAVPT
jgi:superkiller protein 3